MRGWAWVRKSRMRPRPAVVIFHYRRVRMEGAGRRGMEMDKGDGWRCVNSRNGRR